MAYPQTVVPTQGSHGVFVHFRNSHSSHSRCRSAPSRLARGQVTGSDGSAYRRPQKATRERLEQLSVAELAGLLHEYGLPKLCCEEDYRLAESSLPCLGPSLAEKRQIFADYLERLSWRQLLLLVRECLDRGPRRHGNVSEVLMADYLSQVCANLEQGHLRDVPQSKQDSVLSWRMRNSCVNLGLSCLWDEMSFRLNRNELIVATCGCETTLLQQEEIAKLRICVEDCRVQPLDNLLKDPLSLNRAAVLYVTGHYGGEALEFDRLNFTNVWLVVLNMCKTETLAKRVLQQGAAHVICWPAQVPDSIALDFGVALISETFQSSIIESFSQALEVLPSSSRQPKLLLRSSDRPVPPLEEKPEHVVLHLRDVGSSANSKTVYKGKKAQVLWHTSVNGWVLVAVDSEVIKWRVGQWTTTSNTYDIGSELTSVHGVSEGVCTYGDENTAPLTNHSQRYVRVVLKPQKNKGKAQYAGRVAQVLWESSEHGWVKVKLGSKEVKWRIGHWVPAHQLGGGSTDTGDLGLNEIDSDSEDFFQHPDQNTAAASQTQRPVKVILKPQKNKGKAVYAGQTAQVLWESAKHGWVKVRLGSQEIPWRIGHWVPVDELDEDIVDSCTRILEST